jgi:Ca2+-transporting ATPase
LINWLNYHKDEDSVSAASLVSEHLALAHASVAGRTRFEVAGLYRCHRIKQRLESVLNDVNGVQRVTANVLTGRLLVIYQPDITMEDIIAAIEEQLFDVGEIRSKPRQSATFDTLKIKQAIDSAAGLFDSIPAIIRSIPIFTHSPAQSTTTKHTEAQKQDAWHLQELDDLLKKFDTSRRSGLDDEEAFQRLQRF